VFRGVDVDIHALTHINGQVALMETINHLLHARVNPFGAVASKRGFRQDVRFNPDKLKRGADLLVAPQGADCRRFGPDAPGVVSSTFTRNAPAGAGLATPLLTMVEPAFAPEGQPESSPALPCRVGRKRGCVPSGRREGAAATEPGPTRPYGAEDRLVLQLHLS
jgi:hypothetical protein